MSNEVYSLSENIEQFIRYAKEHGFTALEHEIILKGLCCYCGTCALVCPEDAIEIKEDGPILKKEINCSNCALCLVNCPNSFFSEVVPSEKDEESALGKYLKIFTAKSKNKVQNAQDAGVVSSILTELLEKKEIDAVVVTKDEKLKPIPVLGKTKKDIEDAAGSKYSSSPNVSVLREVEKEKVAFVGLPCHVKGIKKLKALPPENFTKQDNVKLTIGLFCMESFTYSALIKLLTEKYSIKLDNVKKMNIKGKNLIISHDTETLIPLTEANKYVVEACNFCDDLTSQYADISIGAIGSPDGYCTVIARTQKGLDTLNKLDSIELEEIKDMSDLNKLASAKKYKASKNIKVKLKDELDPPLANLLR